MTILSQMAQHHDLALTIHFLLLNHFHYTNIIFEIIFMLHYQHGLRTIVDDCEVCLNDLKTSLNILVTYILSL